jgi:competence protein ComEC
VSPPPVVVLVLAFGAGLATGLARFLGPWPVIFALVGVGWVVRSRPLAPVIVGALAIGRLSALVAWEGEGITCRAALPRGAVELTLLPIDPAPVQPGKVEAEVPGAACGGAIDVRWPEGRSIEVGRAIRVKGKWYPRAVGPFGRPGGALVVKEIGAPVPGVETSRALRLRASLFEVTRRLYGSHAPLIDALLFDRRGALDRDLRDRFAASGLVHLLSISGFHVGLIVGWALVIFRGCRVRRERAWILATVLGVGYVAWLGWPAPATRAAALAVLMCVARLRQRVIRWDALLATTALIVLLADPWAIADIGAWLSVLSLGGATAAVRWSDLRVGTGAMARTLSGSVGATVATAPITAGALGSVSLAGLLLNFVGIPVAAIAVPAVLAAVLLAPLWDAGARSMATGGAVLLDGLDRLAALGAQIPYGHFTTESGWSGAWPWVALLAATAWCISSRATGSVAMTRAIAVGGAALWASLASTARDLLPSGAPPGVTLAFLDVGQGDATLIRTPHGGAVLVDAGPAGNGADAGRKVVVPFLFRHGIRRLDAVILSHAHLDHYGGIPAVLDRFRVARFLEPGQPVNDPGYLSLLDRVEEEGARWGALRQGDTLRIDGVELIVLHPDTTWGEWGLDLNEDSDVLLLRYGGFEALLAGDAGLPAERLLRGQVGDVELLKVGHHGSAGSTGAEWLAELEPEIAVISVGKGNRYRHPSAEALGRLGASGAEVWRTDEVGTVELWTDGVTFRVRARGRERVLPTRPSGPYSSGR